MKPGYNMYETFSDHFLNVEGKSLHYRLWDRASKQDIDKLVQQIEKNPKTQVTLNLISKRVQFFEDSFVINMPDPQRESFLKGTWDVLSLLKERSQQVQALSDQLYY